MPPEVSRNSVGDFGEVWPPGFRFHPTDEELVLYYLKRKICRRKLKLDIIGEVDVYKWDPEELPDLSLLKTQDRQWFFFSPRDRKYPNGSRSNRATRHGYWKATGKDRTISCNSRTVGFKKTLVFYKGRTPSGERTDWVMHEYTLDENELSRCQDVQDYYALYKLYKKGGAGPRNGEQYGAPFREEDWVDDELPEVSNYNEADNHMKQSNGIASMDMHKDKPQVQCRWNDIEEFMKQFVDDPVPEGPVINDYECTILKIFDEEESQSTLTDPSFGNALHLDQCKMQPPYGQQNVEGSMNLALSATSQVQLDGACEVASNGATNLEQHVLEEDFLEMNDLLGPETTRDVGELMPQTAGVEATVNSQWGVVDALSELDLYCDAEMFLREPSPLNQSTASYPCADYQASEMVKSDNLEGKQLSYAMNNIGTQQGTYDKNFFFLTLDEPNMEAMPFSTTGGLCAGNFIPNAMERNSNESQNGKGVEGDDKWYTSALWSFVESIPTTPASAADSALVNRALERVSSFTRLRINPKGTTAAAATVAATSGSSGGRMKGFFLFSFMGALFAILFVLIGIVGKYMLPHECVK